MKNILKLTVLVFVIFIFSFILLISNTNKLGGDAISGYREGENYYIMTSDGYKEVTFFLWHYNYLLFIITLTTAIIFSLGFLYLMIRYAMPYIWKNYWK